MYAGRIACCPLMSHVDYALRALLSLEKDAMRPTAKDERDRRLSCLHYV